MQTDNEKYNEKAQPNTAFMNELKNKLPEFFTKDGSFDLEKFVGQLKDKNVDELSEGYQLVFIGKNYARRQAGEMPRTVIVPDEQQNKNEGKNSKTLFLLATILRYCGICRTITRIRLTSYISIHHIILVVMALFTRILLNIVMINWEECLILTMIRWNG